MFVKSAVKWNGYEACDTSLFSFYLFIYLHDAFFVFVVQCLIVGFLTF